MLQEGTEVVTTIPPISAYLVQGEASDEEVGQIMDSWEVLSLNEDGIDIRLDLPKPLAVSQSITPDLMLVQLDLSEI